MNAMNEDTISPYSIDTSNIIILGVDIETTGLNVQEGDKILSVAIHYNNHKKFYSLVNPEGRKSTVEAQTKHQLNENDTDAAKSLKNVVKEMNCFINRLFDENNNKGIAFVAHNAKFDMDFIKSEVDKIYPSNDFPITQVNKWDCTLELSRRLFPKLNQYSLDKIARHLKIIGRSSEIHLADEDARICRDCYIKMLEIQRQQEADDYALNSQGYKPESINFKRFTKRDILDLLNKK